MTRKRQQRVVAPLTCTAAHVVGSMRQLWGGPCSREAAACLCGRQSASCGTVIHILMSTCVSVEGRPSDTRTHLANVLQIAGAGKEEVAKLVKADRQHPVLHTLHSQPQLQPRAAHRMCIWLHKFLAACPGPVPPVVDSRPNAVMHTKQDVLRVALKLLHVTSWRPDASVRVEDLSFAIGMLHIQAHDVV